MLRTFCLLTGLALFMAISIGNTVIADTFLETFQEGQKINGFSVVNLYENGAGKAMGARFVSDKHGFIVDLMQIQSVPQGFFWVKTPPTSDMGEPHACEHLLLGKGTQGRYVSALEDMCLGKSSAWTGQTNTVYHFNTVAGEETFYELFEAKLRALLNPDFTDEEIRREICHIGVNIDPRDGSLSLEEKGTVYTEMVSYFEKASWYQWKAIEELLYGEDHPLGNRSGGYPPDIRKMTAEDMWRFHKNFYRPDNMGIIASIPDAISVESFLEKTSGILDRCSNAKRIHNEVGMTNFDFPQPASVNMAATTQMVPYPSENLQDPSDIIILWPASLDLDNYSKTALDIFLGTFAGGPTSNLYDLFIKSETRKIDLGSSNVWGSYSSELGNPIYFGIDGSKNEYVDEAMLDKVRNMIITEIENVSKYPDDSEELRKFNENAKSRLIQSRKQVEKYLNSPPMFGFRAFGCAAWQGNLEFLEGDEGFRKSMVMKDHFDKLEAMLAKGGNFWKEYIDSWNLLKVKPHALAMKPSPEMLQKLIDDKQARIAGYIENFKKKYNVSDEQEALAKYKEEFDANTAEIEKLAAKDEIPPFIDNPPMTVDDQLIYEVIKLNNGIELVASTFENMSTSEIAIALRLDVVPESHMLYLPFLTTVLTGLGVEKDGQIIKYEEMKNRLQEEVLNYNAYFDYGFETGRSEIVLKASGNNRQELENALEWMNASLYSPWLATENIPRMIDVIDQALVYLRNTMQGREEYWVNYPATAYKYQSNPIILSTNCFLTKVHHYQRLKWLLTDPGSEADQTALIAYLDNLKTAGKNKTREQLNALLDNPPALPESENLGEILGDLTSELKKTLVEIPDENLGGDWEYLLNQAQKDLLVKPATALNSMKMVLNLLLKADNARMFMISNSSDRLATMDLINDFAGRLDSRAKSKRVQYAEKYPIIEHLKSRTGDIGKPVYVGLVNKNTTNGVLIFSARNAEVLDTSHEAVLKYLSGKLYGGGGGHGIFMKTWGAGLAYSNGYNIGQRSGNASYYAERCPDVAETMRFVVSVLKEAENDPRLVDYAIAQTFGYSRAPNKYETRGEAMASDLADGYLPQRDAAFRRKALEIADSDNLYEELVKRMQDAYGTVLIGYGKPLSQSREGSFFLIGPEPQFESLEEYIESMEEPQKVYKLYPRDFWLTTI